MIVFKKFIKELLFFEGYFRVVTTHVCMAQPKRILSTLEKNTQARYLEFCTSYSNIENSVANHDFANYLGASPENLSRVRKKLKS